MTNDDFWQIFTDTGDPMGWLLYRAADKKAPRASDDDNRAEGNPTPSD